MQLCILIVCNTTQPSWFILLFSGPVLMTHCTAQGWQGEITRSQTIPIYPPSNHVINRLPTPKSSPSDVMAHSAHGEMGFQSWNIGQPVFAHVIYVPLNTTLLRPVNTINNAIIADVLLVWDCIHLDSMKVGDSCMRCLAKAISCR